LVGGVGAGFWMLRRQHVPIVPALAAATPALAAGHAIGRIGCFLVGDDYGRPSDLPWAVAFPEGLPPTTVPVHPTQLYEAAALAALAWLLVRWRRAGPSDAIVLGRYLVLAGSIRFAVEFIRVNARILGPLTLAQLVVRNGPVRRAPAYLRTTARSTREDVTAPCSWQAVHGRASLDEARVFIWRQSSVNTAGLAPRGTVVAE
jgi:phosphatidylglycerol---prolipoprotein diacylglyceryl transferase